MVLEADMAITITRAEVKRKSMIPSSETTYDSDIDALIAEMQPSVEYTIADSYLGQTSDTKLQAVLKLGILEILSGEFLQQLQRETGASEDFSIGGLSVGARRDLGANLTAQGTARLRPFQKATDELPDGAEIASNTSETERTFDAESMKVW
jgi:hypothetical protein